MHVFTPLDTHNSVCVVFTLIPITACLITKESCLFDRGVREVCQGWENFTSK